MGRVPLARQFLAYLEGILANGYLLESPMLEFSGALRTIDPTCAQGGL